MGIYDRDYYRESSGGWRAALEGHGGTWGLIAVTVSLFITQLLARSNDGVDPFSQWLAYSLPDVMNGQVWRLLTAHFVHRPVPPNLLWVGLGMLVLYWFGSPVEGIYGPREFVGFYLAAGLAITGGKLLLALLRVDTGNEYLGCSAALTAVLVLFACHYPTHRILVMFIIPMPVWLLVVLLVGVNMLAFAGGGFGVAPHLIAAAFGFLYHRTQIRITGWLPRLAGLAADRRRPRLRVFEEPRRGEAVVGATAPAPRSAAPASSERSVDEQLEAKLDHVLEKVSRYGRESLTSEEQEILQRASEIYKRRRGS